MLSEIGSIGTNINQMAKVANSSNGSDIDWDALSKLTEFRETLKEFRETLLKGE